jgi:hypothetical protein
LKLLLAQLSPLPLLLAQLLAQLRVLMALH